MHSRFVTYSGIVVSFVIIGLQLSGNLTLYIHPRYIWFTVIFCGFGAIMLILSLQHKPHANFKSSAWIVVVLAAVALLIPARSLSPEIASNRIQSSAAGNQTTLNRTAVDNFSTDLTRFSIQDWDSFLKSQPSREAVVGKDAAVEGFVFRSDGQTFLARYKLSCCAVDATPLTIPLTDAGSSSDGTWLQVTGVMVAVDSREYPYQLQPTATDVIPEPKDPYVF